MISNLLYEKLHVVIIYLFGDYLDFFLISQKFTKPIPQPLILLLVLSNPPCVPLGPRNDTLVSEALRAADSLCPPVKRAFKTGDRASDIFHSYPNPISLHQELLWHQIHKWNSGHLQQCHSFSLSVFQQSEINFGMILRLQLRLFSSFFYHTWRELGWLILLGTFILAVHQYLSAFIFLFFLYWIDFWSSYFFKSEHFQ